MPEVFLIKLQAFIKKETLIQVFLSEFWEILSIDVYITLLGNYPIYLKALKLSLRYPAPAPGPHIRPS